jgi:transcriptional regulator with XRE-family HTH domain
VAARIGTTQSAVARLESATRLHPPSIATLQRYARALGYRLEVKLVKDGRSGRRPGGHPAKGVGIRVSDPRCGSVGLPAPSQQRITSRAEWI